MKRSFHRPKQPWFSIISKAANQHLSLVALPVKLIILQPMPNGIDPPALVDVDRHRQEYGRHCQEGIGVVTHDDHLQSSDKVYQGITALYVLV